MTIQNEHLHQKISQLEKDNSNLLKALYHTEAHRSAAEQTTTMLERFIEAHNLSAAKEVYLRQEGLEGDVERLVQQMGSVQQEVDSRSVEKHMQRQEFYAAMEDE